MRVAALQTDIIWENPQANFERLAPRIAAASAAGARLVVLPEMFAHGFSMDTASVREPLGGPSCAFLRTQAMLHGLWVCGSAPELGSESDPASAARPYNTLLVADPHGNVSRYRKIHPFTFADEHLYYAAGSEFLTLEIEGVRATFFVCYDLRFADEFWVNATRTDVFVVVANWPERRRRHWQTLLRARAIENQTYLVAVNRVGRGSGLTYMGDSAIVDPWGETLAEASRDETMLLADIDPARIEDARTKFPVLGDRRENLPLPD